MDPYTFTYGYHKYTIPDYMRGGLNRYIDHGVIPGSFLQAVICNDLKNAIGMADENNLPNLPAYVNFFYNYAPRNCWGSKEKMNAWIKHHQNQK